MDFLSTLTLAAESADKIQETVNATMFNVGDGNGIWYLIGAALVFFMQCGFAMVETGFTRAKNAGNIIMKNLMDFCLGTIAFVLLGFGLMLGEDTFFGLIGVPNLDVLTQLSDFNRCAEFVFNLVFCATAATIVSGAMAERTKFISYCIYSFVISLVVYPIEAHWIWGGGWLAQLGFVDFAGSTAIHMVGGLTALIGAAMVGPRIGKFSKDGKPRAILGHSIPLGALGVFILWFGWYGFNGAAASNVDYLADIFLTTTIAPAVATVVTMIFTWLKNGKPDVSMCLNASLAGLVAITAPCADTDALGSAIIGIVSGLLVCFGVWLLDYKLKVDDPVGAVAVHFFNGVWGSLAVGLFATFTMPEMAQLLGTTRSAVYTILDNPKYSHFFEFIVIAEKKRITKESFQKFLEGQGRYKLDPSNDYEELAQEQNIALANFRRKKLSQTGIRGSNGNIKYLTFDEASYLAKVSRSMINKWADKGKFTVIKVGSRVRIRRDEFEDWMEQRDLERSMQ